MSDSAQDRALFQRWITSPAAGHCRRNPDGSRYDWAAEERSKPRITDEERKALEIAVEYVGSAYSVEHHAETIRKLLERTK
jgi:hypothetical protein